MNADESFWRCEEYYRKTLAHVISESVLIHVSGPEKAVFTALATIAANGTRFPLVLVAKGKNYKVEKNWFGGGRSLSSPGILQKDLMQNPYYGIPNSCRSTQEKVNLKSFTDCSIKVWADRAAWQNYLYALRYKFIKPSNQNFYSEENRIY